MAGLGGVFPNHEDHLLDKKKISEYFSGNFHEILYPLNYSSKYGPWQYHCPPDHKNFIDLNTLTWNGKVKVINKTDPELSVISGSTKDINCSVVNNPQHDIKSDLSDKRLPNG